MSIAIYTIGHSNRSAEEFVELLRRFAVDTVIDVRTVPRSAHNPQFAAERLADTLSSAGIRYVHCPELGGFRRPRPDSMNAAWRNRSFRGYADYMQTEEFASALDEVLRMASAAVIAVMCAEAVPWRCHRRLIADALTIRGAIVRHIIGAQTADVHEVTPFAKIIGTTITYP